ncbi:MAG: Ig-like domain-containing protein, partial [Anaerolineae bacterium]|nr:Ig-like domain-containing protein [Anaerolineae bacterium]
MNKQNQSALRSLVLVTMLFLVVVSLACATFIPTTKTPEPEPTASPTPTVTPVPPRPVIPYTPVPSDMLAPILVQRSPKQGQMLAPDGTIELVFDKPMDQQTVAKALRVERAGTTQTVDGTLSWVDDRTVTFSPSAELPRDETYDVILTQDAKASTGETLRQPYTFRFSIVGALQVTQVIPAADTTDIETDAMITVMFNRPVVPLTTLQQMEALPDPLTFEPALTGNGEWLNTSIYVFQPDVPLAGGITYKITVSDELRDLSGTPLADAYTWQFTTVPPKVLWVAPRENATLVDINTAITVNFNQPIDAASATAAFSLRGTGVLGGGVRGTVDVQGSTLIFTPTRPLEFDSRFTVTIDVGVTSTAGGRGMAQPYTWKFTTVPLPEIVETYPKDGDRNAPSHTEFRIVFNTPIDPATVMPNLAMTPPLSATQVHTYFSEYNSTFVLYFGAQPSTDYEVRIADGIADPYGNTIPRGRTVRFTTTQLPPTYQLRTPDFIGTYDTALPARLVVAHLNLDQLNLRLYGLPISAIQEEPWRWQDRDKTLPKNSLIREWRENLPSPLNEQQQSVINLTEETGGTLSPGVYLLDVEAPDLDRDSWRRIQRHILVVSTLNLTLKTGPEETLVWAVDLATGNPVPDLKLMVTEIYEGRQGSITTDSEGIARLELPHDYHNLMVLSETPFAAVASDWGRGISPWDFGVGGGLSSEDYQAYIYTDRAIYRPGQTMAFKGVIRAEDDAQYSLPGVSSVTIEIRSVTGEVLYNKSLPVSDIGTFNGSLDLGANASLGEYVISATFADHYNQTYFTVAAYRAPEFEIDVTSAAAEIQRGDTLETTIEVAYFFGGPLKETAVTWNILAESAIFEPPWGGQYTFSDTDDPYRCFGCWWYEPPAAEPLLSGTGTTDNEGRLTVTISGKELSEVLPTGTQQVVLEATAVGPDNQQISGRTSTMVHPGPFYIGLQPRTYVSQAGEETDIDLVTVDWQGERLGGNDIKVSLYRREWINTFIENDAGGGRWSWETAETRIDETTLTTDNLGEGVATFVPAEGGSYHVVAEPANPTAETEDIRTSIFIWVSGSDTVAWRRENHDRITLVSDKSTYQVGETAEILIPSPLESPQLALVTVEREGIRRYDVLDLETNSTIYRLPIEAGDIPNIYVSVVLITPHRSGPAEFKMGLLPLE